LDVAAWSKSLYGVWQTAPPLTQTVRKLKMPPKTNLHAEIKLQPISSENLAAIGYDEKREILEVKFDHGETYRYSNISKVVFDAMMGASTPGQYFYHFIRTSYPYYQI
jgi:hypothetical protein